MKYHDTKIIYSINIADVQEVARRVLDRQLTNQELAAVEGAVGDFIDWFGAIESAIHKHVEYADSTRVPAK
jgi:hypothetical protein